MTRLAVVCVAASWLSACTAEAPTTQAPPASVQSASAYRDNSGRPDLLSGGARMISITTPKGPFKQTYVTGVVRFIKDVDGGAIK